MKAGRKPKHAFNTLKIGEKAEMKGKARLYPHQYLYQFHEVNLGKRLVIIRYNGKIYAERVK